MGFDGAGFSSVVEADTPTLEVGEEADTFLHKPRSIARPTLPRIIYDFNYL